MYSRSKHAKHPVNIEALQEYFYLANSFLNDHQFTSNVERIIWEYHTEGLSIREIETVLKKAKVKDTRRNKIFYTITNLKDLMFKKYQVMK